MSKLIEKLEWVAEWGGTKKDIVCLILSGISLLLSIFGVPMPVNPAWVAIILCGVPIVLEAVIGLITAFDIKADVLVSLALIASVCIEGSSDSSIRDVVPTDLGVILRAANIDAVFCNGQTAYRLYERYQLAQTGLPATVLPSTSPANAAYSVERLTESWRVLLPALSD